MHIYILRETIVPADQYFSKNKAKKNHENTVEGEGSCAYAHCWRPLFTGVHLSIRVYCIGDLWYTVKYVSDRQHLYCRQSQSHWSVGINNEIVETITSSQQQVRKKLKNHPFQLELHDHIMRSATENRKDRFLYKSQSVHKKRTKT